jgi:hypothetical protein
MIAPGMIGSRICVRLQRSAEFRCCECNCALAPSHFLKSRIGDYGQTVEPYEKALAIWSTLSREGPDPVAERTGVVLAHTKPGLMERSAEALAHIRPALEIDKEMAACEPNNIPLLRKLFFDYIFMIWSFRAAGGEALGTPEEVRSSWIVRRTSRIAWQRSTRTTP